MSKSYTLNIVGILSVPATSRQKHRKLTLFVRFALEFRSIAKKTFELTILIDLNWTWKGKSKGSDNSHTNCVFSKFCHGMVHQETHKTRYCNWSKTFAPTVPKIETTAYVNKRRHPALDIYAAQLCKIYDWSAFHTHTRQARVAVWYWLLLLYCFIAPELPMEIRCYANARSLVMRMNKTQFGKREKLILFIQLNCKTKALRRLSRRYLLQIVKLRIYFICIRSDDKVGNQVMNSMTRDFF